MGLLRWLTGRKLNDGDARLDEWRRTWRAACAAPDAAPVMSLSSALDQLGLPDEEVEIEREMLAGLEALVRLHATVRSNGLPVIETGHRVVGTEPCHYSAPVSMPDDASQPSGRLIFTSVRAIFAGSVRATTIPWHAVTDVLHQDRDIVLIRRDRETLYRFRCNVFTDALSGAFLARALASRRRSV